MLAVAASCGGEGVAPRVPTAVQAVAPTSQQAPAGSDIDAPPAVIVRDQDGAPLPGVSVSFQVTAGNGSVVPSVVTTGSDGVAAATRFTLDVVAGTNVVTATPVGLAGIAFTATGVRTPASIEPVTVSTQHAVPGADVLTPPAVRVLDAAGAPMAGVTVNFAVTGGGGTVDPEFALTGEDGIARVIAWTVGPVAFAANSLAATVTGLTPVRFHATASIVPTQVTAITSQSQTAIAGTAVAEPPAVIVRDVQGVVLTGVVVTFQVTSGGGTVVPSSVLTSLFGIARLSSWTLGTTPGANSVVASVAGLPSLTFSAVGTAPAAGLSLAGPADFASGRRIRPASPVGGRE